MEQPPKSPMPVQAWQAVVGMLLSNGLILAMTTITSVMSIGYLPTLELLKTAKTSCQAPAPKSQMQIAVHAE